MSWVVVYWGSSSVHRWEYYVSTKRNHMQIIDGNLLAQTIKAELKEKVDKVVAAGKRKPHLAAVLIGDHPASRSYVTNKVKSCADAGFESTLIQRPAEISQQGLLEIVNQLNDD